MTSKQLSVFIENRKGRLSQVLEVLKENDVNILSLSLADTTEYGLLRLIVNDPKLGKEKLSEKGFSSLLSDVLIVKISHKTGSLQELLKKIEKAYDPFWFCAFGGCEGACKECKDTCEMSIFVKERKKFYDKFNENICTFKLENKSQEYADGYAQATADICGRLDETAMELGVNIKEN